MIKLIIDGEEFEFEGDELLSETQQAILFLEAKDEERREF